MIPYLAVAIALLIGFCFGCLTMALAHAAKRQPAGSAPGYRKLCVFFVMEAKKEETRMRRLERLIKVSSEGKRLL